MDDIAPQLPPGETPEISVVIPTLREVENIAPIVERIAATLAGRRYEIIIVDDDSNDGTIERCDELAQTQPIHLIVRTSHADGLSGAVLAGLHAAAASTLVVMDADLQHPPEVLPALIAPVERGEANFTLGSRYIEGGGVADTWSVFRRVNSRVATLLARPFARGVNDPMSGFFAISREAFERGEHIAPTGYKIALELIAKCHVGTVKEVPIRFGLRERGQSKLTMREQFRYLEHLSRLYDFTYPRGVPAIKFLITVAIAFVVSLLIFLIRDQPIAWVAAVAYLGGVGATGMFHARYVRTQREFLVRPSPWQDFWLSAFCEIIVMWLVAAYLFERAGMKRPIEGFIIAFLAATVTRYLMRKELKMDVRGLRYREHA